MFIVAGLLDAVTMIGVGIAPVLLFANRPFWPRQVIARSLTDGSLA